MPEPGLGRQLEAAAHEVADDVAVADQDVDGGLRDLDGGLLLMFLTLLVFVPLSRLQLRLRAA